jgi:hypothetical protein
MNMPQGTKARDLFSSIGFEFKVISIQTYNGRE